MSPEEKSVCSDAMRFEALLEQIRDDRARYEQALDTCAGIRDDETAHDAERYANAVACNVIKSILFHLNGYLRVYGEEEVTEQ